MFLCIDLDFILTNTSTQTYKGMIVLDGECPKASKHGSLAWSLSVKIASKHASFDGKAIRLHAAFFQRHSTTNHFTLLVPTSSVLGAKITL